MIWLSLTLRDESHDPDYEEKLLHMALPLARQADDSWCIAFTLYLIGLRASRQMKFDAGSRQSIEDALQRFRLSGDRFGASYAAQALAYFERERGDIQRAAALHEECIRLSRELGNRRGICFGLFGLGSIAHRQKQLAVAASRYAETLGLWRDLGNLQNLGLSVAAIASLMVDLGDTEAAARLMGAAEGLIEASGGVLFVSVRDNIQYERAVATAREALGEAEFAAALRDGRALSTAAAIAAATDAAERCQVLAEPARGEASVLSPRELEVAVLVAEGLSNREIAERLVIATRTAETHVTNCLTKLGLHARSQLATWVAVHGLLAPGQSKPA